MASTLVMGNWATAEARNARGIWTGKVVPAGYVKVCRFCGVEMVTVGGWPPLLATVPVAPTEAPKSVTNPAMLAGHPVV
jgi:hypothetical protein